MGDQFRRSAELATKNLSLENYEAYYNNHHPSSSFNVLQLENILHFHGFTLSRRNRLRTLALEAVNGIDNLLNPHRSTVNEMLSSCNPCVTIDEVNGDLTSLNWQEEFPITSFQSISTANNTGLNVIRGSGIEEKKRNLRTREVKNRKVFDAVHSTKPRSNCVKRKRRSDVFEIFSSVFDEEKHEKVRKVFDVIHLTKPRSKRSNVKRKRLTDVIDFGGISSSFD